MATKRLYRSRRGQIFGVCQGIADWRDLPVDTLRLIVAIAILATGVFPGLAIYALLGLFLPLEPEYSTHSNYSQTRRNTHEQTKYSTSSREDLRKTFESLKRKVEGMEEEIFDKERDWDQRFHEDVK